MNETIEKALEIAKRKGLKVNRYPVSEDAQFKSIYGIFKEIDKDIDIYGIVWLYNQSSEEAPKGYYYFTYDWDSRTEEEKKL